MKKSKKIAFIVASAFLLALSNKVVANAYFDGDDGDSGGTGGGSCASYYGGTGWCSKVRSWYFYEYTSGVDYGQINVKGFGGAFAGLSLTKSVDVPKNAPYDCDKTSSGFYVSGLTLFQHYSENPDWGFNDGLWTPHGSWDGRFIGLAKYDSSKVYYDGSRVLLTSAPLSHDAAGNAIKAIYAVPKSEVEARWDGTDGKEGAKKQAEKAERSTDLSDYSYFCAGDIVKKQGQNYKGSAKIKINTDNSTDFSDDGDYHFEYSDSGNGGTDTRSDTVVISQGSSSTLKIAVESYGKVEKNGGTPDGYDEGYSNTSYSLSADKTASGSTSSTTIISATPKSGTVVDDYAESGNPTKDIELQAGVTYTLCAINDYYSTYRSDSAKGYENSKTVKACIKIKYEPTVAEIDSKTTLHIGPTATESGWDSSATYSLGEVNYGADAINAAWSYTLISSKRCFEGDFKNGACSENKTSITSSFKVPFNRVGDVVNNSGDSTLSSPGYSAAPEASSKSYNLLPGEPLTQKQGISHKSGVRTDGAAVNGAIDESSSVELTAKAKDATCNLNNQPFGLTNPINYGRLTITAKSRSFVYGDTLDDGNSTWADAGTVWLKPDDSVQLSYEACIGEQIKRDKNSSKGWEDAFTDNNAVLTVSTSGNALDGSHYTGVTDAVDVSSDSDKSIVAYEKIGNTITGHVSNDYQFVGSKAAKTNSAFVNHLGQTITNDFGNLNKDIHAAMKIPYNYNLDPSISPLGNTVTTIGGETKFEVSVKREERTNQQVDATNSYKTTIKPNTKAKYVSFRLPSDFNYATLSAWQENHKTIDGDITDDLDGFIRASLHSSIGIIGGGEISSADINSDKVTTVTVGAGSADTNFNKLCVIAGVYPADSHNVRDKDINNENQDNALTDGAGSGAFTRISVSCKTVGKYPTTSVEGNGIVAGGSVNGAYTTYSGRNYGSWTEYGLVADSVQNFASGASAAYTNAQTAINASAASDLSGIKTTHFDSPQTLGNMSMNVGLQDAAEASLYASQMQSYVEDVKSTFFNGASGGSEIIKKFNNKTYVNTNFNGDVEISQSLANDINAKANDGLVIIYSTKDIRISNKVQTLNAVLLADGKVDTCSEADQGGDNGQLLEKCYNPLVVNGVVFSNEDITLDRVYGGGSTTGMDLNADALIQRAEIFNFDPEIVSWGYNFKFETQPITTTYIEELSTRY